MMVVLLGFHATTMMKKRDGTRKVSLISVTQDNTMMILCKKLKVKEDAETILVHIQPSAITASMVEIN